MTTEDLILEIDRLRWLLSERCTGHQHLDYCECDGCRRWRIATYGDDQYEAAEVTRLMTAAAVMKASGSVLATSTDASIRDTVRRMRDA